MDFPQVLEGSGTLRTGVEPEVQFWRLQMIDDDDDVATLEHPGKSSRDTAASSPSQGGLPDCKKIIGLPLLWRRASSRFVPIPCFIALRGFAVKTVLFLRIVSCFKWISCLDLEYCPIGCLSPTDHLLMLLVMPLPYVLAGSVHEIGNPKVRRKSRTCSSLVIP